MSETDMILGAPTRSQEGYVKLVAIQIQHESKDCKCEGLNPRCRFQSVKWKKKPTPQEDITNEKKSQDKS